MSVRRLLPARRVHTVITLEWAGTKYHVGFGQEGDSKTGVIDRPDVLEVFADGKRTGSDQQAQLSDACIAISLLLQHGVTVEQLAAAFGEVRNEGEETGHPASVLGAIVRAARELEMEGKAG